jgi:hypothetical protein
VKLCPNRHKRPRSTQGAYFQSHARSVNQRVNISQGLPDWRPLSSLILFIFVALRTKSKGLPDWCLLSSLILFTRAIPQTKSKGTPDWCPLSSIIHCTCVAPRTKTRDSWLMSLIISYTFYTRSAMYKKQGAPDWCPDLSYTFYAQWYRFQLIYHRTFHSQQTSVYEKHGASIYLYPSSWYSENYFIQVYNLT